MNKFAFGEKFQESVLAFMLKDVSFAVRAVRYIPEDQLYSDKFKYLFGLIKRKLDLTLEPLTYIEAEDHLKKIEPAKRKVLKSFVQKIFVMDVAGADYMREQLTTYAKRCSFVDSFQEAQVIYNSENYQDAFEYMTSKMSDLYTISFMEDTAIDVGEFEDKRNEFIAQMRNQVRKIPTNIGPLDKILHGGLERGELGILLAEPKKGKSIGLNHMGAACLRMRSGKIAHFVLEGTTQQSIFRYLSNLSEIPYFRIANDELTKEEYIKLENIKNKYGGKMRLIPFNQHWNYTPQNVEGSLRELESQGFNPDLVVIDYADLLSCEDKKLEKRHEQTEVYRQLKRLAVMKQKPIWTASQAVRPQNQPEEAYLLRAKDISESFEKVRIADLICTLNQTPKEKHLGIIRFHVDIYRSEDADRTFCLVTNFEKMLFHSKRWGVLDPDLDIRLPWKGANERAKL